MTIKETNAGIPKSVNKKTVIILIGIDKFNGPTNKL